MTRTELFEYLGAPLVNPRWSWGAVRVRDNAVFLLVWQDEHRRIDSRAFTKVGAPTFYENAPGDLGYAERMRHLDLIRAGAHSSMIMCLAADPKAAPRTIASFNDKEVFVGGQLIQADGDWWLERITRRRIDTAR